MSPQIACASMRGCIRAGRDLASKAEFRLVGCAGKFAHFRAIRVVQRRKRLAGLKVFSAARAALARRARCVVRRAAELARYAVPKRRMRKQRVKQVFSATRAHDSGARSGARPVLAARIARLPRRPRSAESRKKVAQRC
jgi:hypothetical protein